MNNTYILAMYDVRGKQEYIYKSNKMKEIIGASYIIRDCFEKYLYPAAKEYNEGKGLFDYRKSGSGMGFSEDGFVSHLEAGYVGELIYDGGGSCLILYRDKKAYREINRRFYRDLLVGTYSLRVLTSYIVGVDFENFEKDWDCLETVHRKREQSESLFQPVNALPIVQVDYRNYMPLSDLQHIGNEERKVSYESKQKYKKYEEIKNEEKQGKPRDAIVEGERLLDEIVTEKGEESLLAVIYIDGNNMGERRNRCFRGENKSYAAAVKALRAFSAEIQTKYIDERVKNVDAVLEKDVNQKRRFVIYAGDEITFICNARRAYDVALEYLQKLSTDESESEPRTSCAGIAIFHSHMPFSEAYRIAEECCESGKKLMKKQGIRDTSLLDFHYCQGAIGTSLEDIRQQDETTDISRPWFIRHDKCEKDENGLVCGHFVTKEIVEDMKGELHKMARSNVKDLMFSAKKGEADFLMELERIKAHDSEKETQKKMDFSLGGKLDDTMQQKLIYDMTLVYDLWFPKKEGGTEA